ncbi:30S ribosomal protein S5 [Candidatus Woesearchaeota archaeon]|nr:30S ribosomal protein S5 [Candidatus Woesearchaeota archaeon]
MAWTPKTSIGQKVKTGEINSIDHILDNGMKILEAQIVDILLPTLKNDLLMVGQSKGKFGGGAKRIFRQTQKKTPEGNKPSFSCVAVVGDGNGHVGVGTGKSKDTVPAREKALRQAKLNVFKIFRGCGSWQCGCGTPHSLPFTIHGKCGSSEITILPAPKGKGLCIEEECGKILKLAGITDCWSKTAGQTRVKTNLISACVKALSALTHTKIQAAIGKKLGMVEGKL